MHAGFVKKRCRVKQGGCSRARQRTQATHASLRCLCSTRSPATSEDSRLAARHAGMVMFIAIVMAAPLVLPSRPTLCV